VNSNYRVSEIDAKSNGTWVRKYVLGYGVGDNGYTTLLSSIAESGENASGTVVSLPSSTFNYQLQTPGWTGSSTWNPSVLFVGNNNIDNGYRTGDLNADGMRDNVQSNSSSLDNAAGWTPSSTWNTPSSFTTASNTDSGYRLVDVLGNGKDDFISCNNSYVNASSGWISSSTWNSPICFATSGVPMGAILADANGDGLPVILYGAASSTGALTSTSAKHFQVDSGSTLTNGLTSYYKLEDTSDYYGTSTLTNNGTSSFNAGKVGNAWDGGASNSTKYLNVNSIWVSTGERSLSPVGRTSRRRSARENSIRWPGRTARLRA
jgi:hypothetical protein